MKFQEAYLQAREDQLRKRELKALKRTKSTAEFVTIKVTGKKDMQRFADRGWQLMVSVPSAQATGYAGYVMRRPRVQVEHAC